MNASKKAEFSLAHRLDVSHVADCLARALACDSWYVVCHHEHQFVIHLTRGEGDRYAVAFECTPPADKGIYHGSLASQGRIIALSEAVEIGDPKMTEIRCGLVHLASAAGVHAG